MDELPTDGDEHASGAELLARSDRRAILARWMSAHGDAVFTYCVQFLRDRALAEDVLQRVFLEAHRDLERFEGRAKVRSWLLGIAAHRCKDAAKARRRHDSRFIADDDVAADAAADGPTPAEHLDRARVIAALGECLDGLSDDSRSAVLLRFRAGMSYQDMAGVLDAKADTLNTRVARALAALRRCLERKGWQG